MKNQFFGDINDYRKYGLLRLLSGQGLIKTAVCWMLTENDHGPDGKFITFLKKPNKWRQHDPALFECLNKIVVEENKRDVQKAKEYQIIPSALFYAESLPDDKQGRKKYFKSFMKQAKGCDLIFFDPDNGIEVKSKPYGRKSSSKYLYWNEIKDAFSAGHSLLIYQHFPHVKKNQFIKSTARQLAINTGAHLVYSFRSKHVLFLLACQVEHREPFQDTIQSIKKKWGTQFEIASYINKGIREGEFEIASHSMFSIHRIQRLRQRAEKARQVLEECPEGWSKSKVDPMKLLLSFPSLRLKNGFILRAYQFRSGGDV